MPLDKVLIKHLDEQDILENSIDDDIESLVADLKIPDLMNGSEEVLLNLVSAMQERLKEEYYVKATINGVDLAKNIQKDGDIKIPKSKDGNLNDGVVSNDNAES